MTQTFRHFQNMVYSKCRYRSEPDTNEYFLMCFAFCKLSKSIYLLNFYQLKHEKKNSHK